MNIAETKRDGVTILALEGRLDAETADSLWTHWSPLIDRGDRRFVLDLEQLSYVSSAGLRVLLRAAKLCTVLACGLNPRLQQIFVISGFTRVIPVQGSVDEAVQALQKPA